MQLVNGSYHHGDVTVINRMTDRYAVVNAPGCGKHRKSQNPRAVAHRRMISAKKKPTILMGHLVKKEG